MTAAQAGLLLGCRPLVEFIAVRFWSVFSERFRKGRHRFDFILITVFENNFFQENCFYFFLWDHFVYSRWQLASFNQPLLSV
jgi:hypothetical protein